MEQCNEVCPNGSRVVVELVRVEDYLSRLRLRSIRRPLAYWVCLARSFLAKMALMYLYDFLGAGAPYFRCPASVYLWLVSAV